MNVLEGTFYIQSRYERLSHHRLYVQSPVLLSLNSFENVRPFKMNKNVYQKLPADHWNKTALLSENLLVDKILFLSRLWFLSRPFLFCFDLLSIFPTLTHFVLYGNCLAVVVSVVVSSWSVEGLIRGFIIALRLVSTEPRSDWLKVPICNPDWWCVKILL